MSVAPHRPKGPPLNALRAFEAAARLQSFTAAADELSVTPGAVSQHIKALEGWAGAPLFYRTAKGITPTATALEILTDCGAAFDHIDQINRHLRSLRPVQEFHIATMPSVAQLWLPSRMPKLRAALPETNITVTALETPPNLARELFDLTLFLAEPKNTPDEQVIEKDLIFPVCAPTVLQILQNPSSAADVPRLIDQSWESDWALWQRHGDIHFQTNREAIYSLYALALEEARKGAGILMAHKSLVSEDLCSGSLVSLSNTEVETGKSLIISTPRNQSAAVTAKILGVFNP